MAGKASKDLSKELLTLMKDVRLGLHAKINVVGDKTRPGLVLNPKLDPKVSVEQIDTQPVVPDEIIKEETRKIADEPRIVISAKGDGVGDAKRGVCLCVDTLAPPTADKGAARAAAGSAAAGRNELEGCRRKLTFSLLESNLDSTSIVDQMIACGLLKNDESNRNKMGKAIQAEIKRHCADYKKI